MYERQNYRKDLIKHPGAYLIFRPLRGALIQGGTYWKKIIEIDISETIVKKFSCFIKERRNTSGYPLKTHTP